MLKSGLVLFTLHLLVLLPINLSYSQEDRTDEWAINATIIEACSCPMFCQCYFNPEPAAHSGHGSAGAEHFCRFNNAFKVNKGNFGDVKLDGIKFWLAGDLGDDFTKGEMDWAELTFDPAVTKEQREAVTKIMTHLYPVTWNTYTTAKDAPMEWNYTKDKAVARLDGGKAAEVVLNRFPGNTDEPVVIHNLRYWGVPRNDGFVMMPNEIEAYRGGKNPFEFKGTNGFLITIDMNSKDVKDMMSGDGHKM